MTSIDAALWGEVSVETEVFPYAFGRYLLLAQLGRGGMGAVYLAKTGSAAGVEKHCVLKTVRRDITADPEVVQRFLDEAKVVIQLAHKNICSVFDFGKVGNRYYLAMEHIAGRDLTLLVERMREHDIPFPPAVAFHVACEVLDALDYAHRLKQVSTGAPLGIVHRDVSPQNVMVSFEGEVKLIDFGLAVSSSKSQRTQANVVLGKLRYMSPEHARGDPVDGRSDLFSVAVMTYELVVGEEFYPGHNNQAVWAKAGLGGYRPPRFAEIDPPLRAILDRALDPEADLRFQTCGELKEALEAYAFDNGLRGGAKALRDAMNQLFARELAEVQDLLGRFASTPAPSGELDAAPGTGAAVDPPSTTDAQASDAPGSEAAAPPDALGAPASLEQPSSASAAARRPTPIDSGALQRAAGLGRRRLFARAAAASALVLATGLVLALSGGDDEEAAAAAGSAAGAASPAQAPPLEPLVAAADPTAPAPVVEPEKAAPPAPARATEQQQQQQQQKAPARAAPPRPKRPSDGATITAKIAFLEAHCAKLACTADAQRRKAALAKDPHRERILELQDVLRRCLDACAR